MQACKLDVAIKVIVQPPECPNCRSRSFNIHGKVEDIPEFGSEIFLAPLCCIECCTVLRFPVTVDVLENAVSNHNGYTFKLTINALPKTINNTSGVHWAVIQKESKKWLRLIKGQMIAERIRLPDEPLKKVRIVYTRRSARQLDQDNLTSSFKRVQDALVKLSILEDDNPQIVEAVYRWEKAPLNEGRIEIKLEEILIK